MALVLLSLAATALAQPAAAEEIVGQQQGSATVYHVDRFDSIGLATAATVEVRVGPAWSVQAFGPADALAALLVERKDGTLRLHPRDGWRASRRELDAKVRIVVTLPQLSAASVAGSGQMIVDRASGAQVRASIAGSGSLAFGTVAVDELVASIAGSGSITATGTAARLKVHNSGSGNFRGSGLRVADASVSAAGSGSVRTIVQGPATVSLAGSGVVDLGQGAQCSVKSAGSGRVICGD
jgi:hypothetical protein